ncbi:hypothetical protein MKX03_027393 [Papaver bracteatum]|nr:hypothetical protein MKX03_027393 [Papaver bracteatum]
MEEPKSMKRCHIVAVPFPGRGLINPMMSFCKNLAHKLDDNVKITFVVTEEWLDILESDPKPPQIHLRSIPNVILRNFPEIVVAEMESPFEHFLNTSEPADVIIADFYFMWAISIGNQRNIPVVSFWPSTSLVFSVMYHANLLAKNGHSLTDLSDCCDEVIDYIPGVSPTLLADMPLFPNGNDPKFNPAMVAFTMLDKVQCLLIVTIYELESQVTDTLKENFPFPTYTIGPSISNITTTIEQHHHIHGRNTESNTVKHTNPKEHSYVEWLDSQPISSVLYIAFGSVVSISGEQMEEILAGLHSSGVRYLLVSRGVNFTSGYIHGDDGGDYDEKDTSSQKFVVPCVIN